MGKLRTTNAQDILQQEGGVCRVLTDIFEVGDEGCNQPDIQSSKFLTNRAPSHQRNQRGERWLPPFRDDIEHAAKASLALRFCSILDLIT